MFDIDYIIPCYGKSELIRPGLLALANQWHKEFIHVVLVNDCSPNTDCDYQDLVDEFKPYLDIRSVRTDHNSGQGLCRQKGIDSTNHEYFMFQDEDDRLANPLAVSIFCGAVERNIYKIDKSSDAVIVDEEMNPILDENKPKVGIVSGPLFEFDDQHTHIIESNNHVWVNSKLYCREFLNKHNIRFNEPQSRHAEDYYFTSCFFFCLDNDPEYTGILLDSNQMQYLWWPNEQSQSRIDPHYPFMLAGYTMDGSVNILSFMRDTKRHGIEWNEQIEKTYTHNVLNMTVYSYFNLLAFIKRVEDTDYIPKLEQDWLLLRESCNTLRKLCVE
jgi:glycosyltransferase involved in cell wall biosynthesis